LVEAVQATSEDTASDLTELAADEAQTIQAIAVLETGDKGAYKQALALVREDTAQWWQEVLEEQDEGEKASSPNAQSLLRFLQEEVRPWYGEKREEVARRHLLRSQALSEAFGLRPLEGVARYDVHLDLELERMLAMLL
jgi:hypothetical protein